MGSGWFKFHRELFEKPIWITSTCEQKVILMTLLGMANFKGNEWEFKGKKFMVQPGQFITSLPSIAEKSGKGVTVQNVRTALKRFEKYEFLTDESTHHNRLITIVNWAIYQSEEEEGNNQTNRQLTDDQQTPNRQLTAIKKEKKEKKEKKVEIITPPNPPVTKVQYAENVTMTEQEYTKLIEKAKGEAGAKRMVEILDNYKGSNNKDYASDYRAILSWVVERWVEEEKRKGTANSERAKAAKDYAKQNGIDF